jgi:hypothetical protein
MIIKFILILKSYGLVSWNIKIRLLVSFVGITAPIPDRRSFTKIIKVFLILYSYGSVSWNNQITMI